MSKRSNAADAGIGRVLTLCDAGMHRSEVLLLEDCHGHVAADSRWIYPFSCRSVVQADECKSYSFVSDDGCWRQVRTYVCCCRGRKRPDEVFAAAGTFQLVLYVRAARISIFCHLPSPR